MATINTNSSGGTISGSTTVASTATITGFSILSGGVATISGVDSASTIFAGGAETIVNGGGAVFDTVYGSQIVASGGTATNDVVYGAVTVSGAATVTNTTLVNGGVLTLATGKATEAGTLTMSGVDNQIVVGSLPSSATNGLPGRSRLLHACHPRLVINSINNIEIWQSSTIQKSENSSAA